MVPSASSCNKLDTAVTMLTKQEVEEYLAQHRGDYCSTNNLSNLESETNVLAYTSKLIRSLQCQKVTMKLKKHKRAGVPFKTRKNTELCLFIWEKLQSYRRETTRTTIPPIESLDKVGLHYWLIRLYWK